MLDHPIVTLILAVNEAVQGCVWLVIWLAHRHLKALKLFTAGYFLMATATVALMLRGPAPPAWHIVADNMLVFAATAVLSKALSELLERPQNPYPNLVCLLSAIVFWPLALYFDPTNIEIRIHAAGVILIALIFYAVAAPISNRTQPLPLRLAVSGLLIFHAAMATLRSVLILVGPETTGVTVAAVQGAFFTESGIFITLFSLSTLMMVGYRLSADIRDHNAALEREIAERLRLEAELKSSLESETQLRDEQRQLLRLVTHELRTPIAVVDRAAEMIGLLLEKPAGQITERLSSIQAAIRRLNAIADHFLLTDRSGSELVRSNEITVEELVQSVLQHFTAVGRGEQLRRPHIEPDLPPYWGDFEMLSTVLINLADNAIKYSSPDAEVTIAATRERDEIMISVADRGIGIPTAEAGLIGKRFFRGSNARDAQGTGLGLYNARRLVDYHHGTLILERRDSGGTVAIVRLPLPGLRPVARELKPT